MTRAEIDAQAWIGDQREQVMAMRVALETATDALALARQSTTRLEIERDTALARAKELESVLFSKHGGEPLRLLDELDEVKAALDSERRWIDSMNEMSSRKQEILEGERALYKRAFENLCARIDRDGGQAQAGKSIDQSLERCDRAVCVLLARAEKAELELDAAREALESERKFSDVMGLDSSKALEEARQTANEARAEAARLLEALRATRLENFLADGDITEEEVERHGALIDDAASAAKGAAVWLGEKLREEYNCGMQDGGDSVYKRLINVLVTSNDSGSSFEKALKAHDDKVRAETATECAKDVTQALTNLKDHDDNLTAPLLAQIAALNAEMMKAFKAWGAYGGPHAAATECSEKSSSRDCHSGRER